MKKILLLSAVACSALFYACKKDSTTDTTTPVPEDSTVAPAIDPVALSSNVKIGYGGTNVKGEFPATTTVAETPVLDSIYNGRTYNTMNNRYVVIYPHVMSGFISGYYLQINGADSYFKIDYSAAYGVRRAKPVDKAHPDARDEADNSDSSIVIKLPAGLKGDTFSIKYAAYDSLNHVSNTITAIVNVIASSDSTNNALLAGNWKLTAEKYGEAEDWEPKIDADTSSENLFSCQDDKLSWGGDILIRYYTSYNTQNILFSANNAYSETYVQRYSELDLELSSCSNYVYTPYSEGTYTSNGGYSYNAATKTLTIIYDENGKGQYISTYTYTVKELTSSKLVFYYIEDDNNYHDVLDIDYYEYTKTN